jgi:tRNA 2-selenouridine synthase
MYFSPKFANVSAASSGAMMTHLTSARITQEHPGHDYHLFVSSVKHQHIAFELRADFDEMIDVRTPLEYEEDHIPGAINAPVLSNQERVIIGTMFKQASAHEATRLGAAMVARNIAHHLDTLFMDKPENWKPLIYCWRGGKRSASMTSWFNLIGWKARQLEGGYKSYRRWVLQNLETQPPAFNYFVLIGHTGTGKTRLLHALAAQGAQVLDLEALARHRGSILGAVPRYRQPSQKAFDSALLEVLAGFDTGKPVFIEAESKRIGQITLPMSLVSGMHDSACIRIVASLEERLAFLLEDYGPLFDDHEQFKQQLTLLSSLHGRSVIQRWHEMIDRDAREALFRELIELHAARCFDFRPSAEDAQSQAGALLKLLDASSAGLV